VGHSSETAFVLWDEEEEFPAAVSMTEDMTEVTEHSSEESDGAPYEVETLQQTILVSGMHCRCNFRTLQPCLK